VKTCWLLKVHVFALEPKWDVFHKILVFFKTKFDIMEESNKHVF
jgi:hypothetical protein